MPGNKADLYFLLGISTGAAIAVPIVAYYYSKKISSSNSEDSKDSPRVIIQKSYEDLENVDNSIDQYVLKYSLREPAVLRELRQATIGKIAQHSPMMSDPIQAQLFRLLLTMLKAKKCIEVGTFTGYNALNMALALPPNGKVIACDMSEEYVNVGKPFFEKAGVARKIDLHIRPAMETLDQLVAVGESNTFDFIFIDADKTGYDNYYEKSLELLRPGGLIAIDNTLFHGYVVGGDEKIALLADETEKTASFAIHHLNEKIKHDSRVQVSLLKIADGVTLCRKL